MSRDRPGTVVAAALLDQSLEQRVQLRDLGLRERRERAGGDLRDDLGADRVDLLAGRGQPVLDRTADHYARTLPPDTVVIGSSIGGWLAAEVALRTRVKGLVMINNAGAVVPGEPIASLKGLPPPEIAKLSFHDPGKFRMPPPERLPVMIANQATLYALAGETMADPTLPRRLGEIRVPTLVIWGESDRVVTAAYGRAVAAAIPGARFELVREAGHLPQLEQPEATHRLIADFLATL